MAGDLIALITGYTGETGKALLKELVQSDKFKKIILVGRRYVEYTDREYIDKTEQRQIDFEKIDDFAQAFRDADVHFCCLGTTRSKAGTEGFRKVDFDYIVGAARLAKQEGCKHFHLVSSQNANSHSLFLYPKVKGQTEKALTQMSFERLSIYRPAMLMVNRAEPRPLENFAQSILRNTVQKIAPQWITMPVEVLARAMYYNTFARDHSSLEYLDNQTIFRLSQDVATKQQEQIAITEATNES